MLRYHKGALRVHLLRNRASRWADVHNYLPCEDKVELQFTRRCTRFLVRAPEWIRPGCGEIVCTAKGQVVLLSREGGNVALGTMQRGQACVLQFPILTRRIEQEIGRQRCTLSIKDDTVVAIESSGSQIPLSQREKYLSNQAPMKNVEGFILKSR